MTDPKQSDSGWNLQDLPVLTEVVADAGDELEVPAFDFSAELDELARSMPPQEPELELPPELSLDDVLGDEDLATPGDESALDASKLIERLPSLDLEVDMPGELSLDDVLPAHVAPAVAELPPGGDDFAFDLSGPTSSDAVPPPAEAGLNALFARARFEPVLAAEDADALLPAEPLLDARASMAALQAQLEQFAEPPEMPELPADAFLTQDEPAATLITAAEPDPVWAESWHPAPDTPQEAVQTAELPVLHEALPLAEGVIEAGASQPDRLAAAEHAAQSVEEAESSFHVSLDDLLQSLQPAPAPEQTAAIAPDDDAAVQLPEVETVAAVLADGTDSAQLPDDLDAGVADADWPLAESVATAEWSAEPLAVLDAEPAVAAVASEAAPASEALAGSEPADDDGWPPDDGDDGLAAVEGADAEAFSEPDTSVTAAPAVMPQSISLDSLPTGVLGGGLGLAAAAAAAAAAAQLGASADSLPGGESWGLRSQLRSTASERDVELDWARDLHTEPPQGAALQDEPEAMVMRSRRTAVEEPSPAPEMALAPQLDDIPFHHVAAALEQPASTPPFTMAPAPETPAIRVESVTPPLEAAPALGNVDEAALIEALYARVLPRMKVELSLWMQDALEQQAKLLISGVMQQMKEDFDMMLAQSLKEALREALDEVAPRQDKEN